MTCCQSPSPRKVARCLGAVQLKLASGRIHHKPFHERPTHSPTKTIRIHQCYSLQATTANQIGSMQGENMSNSSTALVQMDLHKSPKRAGAAWFVTSWVEPAVALGTLWLMIHLRIDVGLVEHSRAAWRVLLCCPLTHCVTSPLSLNIPSARFYGGASMAVTCPLCQNTRSGTRPLRKSPSSTY